MIALQSWRFTYSIIVRNWHAECFSISRAVSAPVELCVATRRIETWSEPSAIGRYGIGAFDLARITRDRQRHRWLTVRAQWKRIENDTLESLRVAYYDRMLHNKRQQRSSVRSGQWNHSYVSCGWEKSDENTVATDFVPFTSPMLGRVCIGHRAPNMQLELIHFIAHSINGLHEHTQLGDAYNNNITWTGAACTNTKRIYDSRWLSRFSV